MSTLYKKRKCCISSCPSNNQNSDNYLISFHRIPRDEVFKKKWIDFIESHHCAGSRIINFSNKTLCSLHFKSDDFHNLQYFLKKKDSRLKLKENTYPTLGLNNIDLSVWTTRTAMDVVSYQAVLSYPPRLLPICIS